MAGLALDYYAMVGRLDSQVSRISAIGESQLALSAELTNYFFCVLAEAPTHEFPPPPSLQRCIVLVLYV